MGNKAAVDRLDDQTGSKAVARPAAAGAGASEALEKIGEPSGTRTLDSLLKRQVLYHLS